MTKSQQNNNTDISNSNTNKESKRWTLKDNSALFKLSKSEIETLKYYKEKSNENPVLTKEEEIELIKQFKKDENSPAKHKIINSFLRTIISQAEKYSHRNHLNILDLIQCGIMGVMNALYSFDLKRYKTITKNTGSLFSYYVYRAIIMEIHHHYERNLRQFSVTGYTNTKLYQINEMYKNGELNDLVDENGDDSRLVGHIAKYINSTPQKTRLLLGLFKPSIELDAPIFESSQTSEGVKTVLGECVSPKLYGDYILNFSSKDNESPNPSTIFENKNDTDILMENINKLSPEDQYIITRKFGLCCVEKTSQQIAADIKKQPFYVSSKIKSIQRKLKSMMSQMEYI